MVHPKGVSSAARPSGAHVGARPAGLATADEGRFIAGRYRIEGLIGRGGMGAVYAVTDTTRDVRVALKCTASSAKSKMLELFKREFHTLHGLRHPNIVEVYDYGVDDGQAFYTMELLEGHDLGHAAPLPWREVCSCVRQVATVLGVLHARRLLHRDVTPRNLWVQPDGRIKLLDFGALCPFGVPTEVIGTPPFLAPEWLYDRAAAVRVDQRADLYALGALAYFLLTSAHAYPARSVSDLARAWMRDPAPPSSFAKLIEDRALEPIPPELDALVTSLLRRDPALRPATTEALIDRIDAIAGAPAVASDQHAVHGWVRSKAFVGRKAERALVESYLRFEERTANAVTIEGAPGMGRSRLLEELAVVGRLAGATSVFVRGGARDRAYGLANALALGLFEQAPNEAARTAVPHAQVLASMSPELSARLGVASPSALDLTKRGRAVLQQALTDWVHRLAEARPLLVLADDLERADEESSAWLAALARAAESGKSRLLIVAALLDEPSVRPPLHLSMLRDCARVISLAPLTAAEVQDLLESVFGPAVYLARVADVIYRACKGNPAHCLELIDHLIERGLARYAEGAWSLPGQLSESELPRSRNTMHLLRLERLGTQARALVELLSVHDGILTREECIAIAESDARDAAAALVELTLGGVLSESEQGYVFAHDDVREALSNALDAKMRARAHQRLAAALLASAHDPVDALEAALHFFRAGETGRCEQLVHDAVKHLFAGHRERTAVAVPRLEQVVACYRAARYGPEQLAVPLAALATASFFVDRRLADRYGLAALDALEELLYFDRVPGWTRVIGAKPAFYAALARAGVKLLRPAPGTPTATEALRMLVGTAVGMNAVAVSSLDLAMAARCRTALEPIAVLPEREIGAFTRRCTLAVGAMLTEQPAATLRELRALAKILESDEPIRHLPDHLRREYLGGCLLSIGVMESWRSSRAALEIADRIEPISPMYALDADHLRALYFAGRGEMARADLYRQRVETRALQVGAAWQIVTLGPIDSHITSFWTHDAQLAKRAAAELERLSRELPSMAVEARRARATYLVLNGRYRDTIETMREDDSSPALMGWSRTQGVLARAHNRLGEHERARELCRAALEGRSEEDLTFHLMNLHVQLELSIAEAALGEGPAAHARIAGLLERCESTAGPLALGAMHETRARIALHEQNLEASREAIEAMRRCYIPTQIGSLLELCNQLSDQLAKAELGESTAAEDAAASEPNDDAHMITRMRLILTHSDAELQGRVARALALVIDATRAADGLVVARGDGECVVMSESEPPEALVRWAEAQLDGPDSDETAVLDQTVSESALFCVGARRYCALPLQTSGERAEGMLVLGFDGRPPRTPSQEVLELLARQLQSTRADES